MPNLVERHPRYQAIEPDWIQCRDTYQGERKVKSRRTKYLPATSGQIADGMAKPDDPGRKAYDAYLMRARFPGFMREAVQIAVGMMHSQPSKINLPEDLEDMRSAEGETMEQLLRFVNEEQLITGRIILLPDINEDGEFYLAAYSAERLLNWNVGEASGTQRKLTFAVLDESGVSFEQAEFSWRQTRSFRVLLMIEGVYHYGLFLDDQNFDITQMKPLSYKGRTLDFIPMVIINSCDLVSQPDDPPLMDLSNLCLTIYRGEADYRQNLFMQGQDTLVIKGATEDDGDGETRTGAGAVIHVPMGGDAEYIGVESDGLAEQREALENDRQRAGSMGAQSLDTVSRERESGASLHIRIASRTADLNQVATTAGAGLQEALRHCAVWAGLNPDDVSVEPNMEFGESRLTGQSMVEMQTARNLGFPISAQSLHELAYDKGLTKRTFEEEEAIARREANSPFAPIRENPNGNRDNV